MVHSTAQCFPVEDSSRKQERQTSTVHSVVLCCVVQCFVFSVENIFLDTQEQNPYYRTRKAGASFSPMDSSMGRILFRVGIPFQVARSIQGKLSSCIPHCILGNPILRTFCTRARLYADLWGWHGLAFPRLPVRSPVASTGHLALPRAASVSSKCVALGRTWNTAQIRLIRSNPGKVS